MTILGKRNAFKLVLLLSVIISCQIWSSNMLLVKASIGAGSSLEDYKTILENYAVDGSTKDYKEYILERENVRPKQEYIIKGSDFLRLDGMEVELLSNYNGKEGDSVLTDESGLIEYEANITTPGYYDVSIDYYPIQGKSAAIQRAFFVDDRLIYSELAHIEFQRNWVNEKDSVEVDNQGNDMKQKQVERPIWMTSKLYDFSGYETKPLSVYFTEGVHRIGIVSLREPMVIHRLVLSNESELQPYKAIKNKWDGEGASNSSNKLYIIEGESASRKSSQMLYPMQDQSSPAVTPYSPKELKNNVIGGNSWRLVGQWIEWDFEVEESGYYYISMHAKQNFVKGTYVSRKITIDGLVPFEELSDYPFRYKQNWRIDNLQDSSGEKYSFYLEKGKHTLRMEAVLGEFSTTISEVQDVVSDLNAIYRKVIRITGIAPDQYRDYQIEKSIPGLVEDIGKVEEKLSSAILMLRETSGRSSDKETVLITMRDQLRDLYKDVERFTKVIGSYKINMRACAAWINNVTLQPLQIDSIYIYSPGTSLPKLNNSFIDKFVHEVKRLYYSFIINYNQVGNIAEDSNDRTITLWVGLGRDQANVIKSLIDEEFTKKTNINVNVMLVDMSTLLQATLAGQGPDVAIQVGNDLPMNYGLRNAVTDLSQFDDLEEVKQRFTSSAMTPYTFDGKTYALPETQTFIMMFYRKDILNELGMELPETWEDMKVALSVLSKNQMEFGMLPSEQTFGMFLNQFGGTYYNEDATKSALDSDEAINAFKEYSQFYTDYKLDKETSVEERFRSGEAPIIFADYTTYNNLQVSAPDIKGLWGFAPVPGRRMEDGTINNTVVSTGQGAVILEDSKNKEDSWEFLKWWTSAETQTAYGREMESLMGAAARIATANIEAFSNLGWPVTDYESLSEQFKHVVGIPQVPGGYFTWRNINNAFYKVTTKSDVITPREALMDNIIYINGEIDYKRNEFGMELYEETQDNKEGR